VLQSAADLAADLVRKVPTKIDIGPVYTHDPRQRAKYAKGKPGSFLFNLRVQRHTKQGAAQQVTFFEVLYTWMGAGACNLARLVAYTLKRYTQHHVPSLATNACLRHPVRP